MRSHGTTAMGTSIGAAFMRIFIVVFVIQMNLEKKKSAAGGSKQVRRMALQ